VEVLTLNLGAIVAPVPLMMTEFARSRSKLRNIGDDPTVTLGLKVMFTVAEERVGVSLVGTPPTATTTSGLETVRVAPLYVPGGTCASVRGSKAPAWWLNSPSAGPLRRFPVLAVPLAPVRIMELIVSSNFAIWSLTASPVCSVTGVPVTWTGFLLPPPQPARYSTIRLTRKK